MLKILQYRKKSNLVQLSPTLQSTITRQDKDGKTTDYKVERTVSDSLNVRRTIKFYFDKSKGKFPCTLSNDKFKALAKSRPILKKTKDGKIESISEANIHNPHCPYITSLQVKIRNGVKAFETEDVKDQILLALLIDDKRVTDDPNKVSIDVPFYLSDSVTRHEMVTEAASRAERAWEAFLGASNPTKLLWAKHLSGRMSKFDNSSQPALINNYLKECIQARIDDFLVAAAFSKKDLQLQDVFMQGRDVGVITRSNGRYKLNGHIDLGIKIAEAVKILGTPDNVEIFDELESSIKAKKPEQSRKSTKAKATDGK